MGVTSRSDQSKRTKRELTWRVLKSHHFFDFPVEREHLCVDATNVLECAFDALAAFGFNLALLQRNRQLAGLIFRAELSRSDHLGGVKVSNHWGRVRLGCSAGLEQLVGVDAFVGFEVVGRVSSARADASALDGRLVIGRSRVLHQHRAVIPNLGTSSLTDRWGSSVDGRLGIDLCLCEHLGVGLCTYR